MNRLCFLRSRRTLLALVLPLAFAPVPLGVTGADAASTGLVRGGLYGAAHDAPKAKILVFNDTWHYMRTAGARDGIFSIRLTPGTYWLQAVDQRPAYDVEKYAPANARVRVRAGHTTVRNITMHRGAAIVGTMKLGDDKAATWSPLVAVNGAGESFWTKTNGRGQYAVGGLPAGSYSVYGYDRGHAWVGKNTWVPKLHRGKVADRDIALKKRGGRLLIDLYGGSRHLTSRVTVTVVSRATGQFWSARSTANGTVTFAGLHRGRYTISVPGAGDYLAAAGNVRNGKVRPGRVAFGSFRLTRRGATLSGRVVDRDPGTGTTYPLAGARASAYDSSGHLIASTTAAKNGTFHMGGQLLTQGGVRVVVRPSADGGGWMSGESYCEFVAARAVTVRLVTGQDTAVGTIVLPRAPGQGNPECATAS